MKTKVNDAFGLAKHDKLSFLYFIQGGLDCYCAIYAIVNMYKFINSISYEDSIVFFRKMLCHDEFKRIEHFGGVGIHGRQIVKIAGQFLDLKIIHETESNRSDGRNKIIRNPEHGRSALSKSNCIIWIQEPGDNEDEGHWICTTPDCHVLDSIRGIAEYSILKSNDEDILISVLKSGPFSNPDWVRSGSIKCKVHCVIACETGR